jgi:hypothetical protein
MEENIVRSNIPKMVTMKITIFLDMTPCSLIFTGV